MNNQEVLLKEIDLIQACIKRMADNSFLLKGWTITILVAVLAFFAEKKDVYSISIILLIATINFWYLDAFFLRAERMYRKLYEWVISNRMNTLDNAFDLNPNRFSNQVEKTFQIMISKTLRSFYGTLSALLFIFLIYKPILFAINLTLKNKWCELLTFLVEKGGC